MILEYTGVASPYREVIGLPEHCELAVREKNGKVYYFVLNYSAEPQEITLKRSVVDLDTKQTYEGGMVLKPYETKVFRDPV